MIISQDIMLAPLLFTEVETDSVRPCDGPTMVILNFNSCKSIF